MATYAGGAIAYRSMTRTVTATSSTEAEFVAAVDAVEDGGSVASCSLDSASEASLQRFSGFFPDCVGGIVISAMAAAIV